MATSSSQKLHTIPISSRPSSLGLRQRLLSLAFGFVFYSGCLMIHGSQLLFLVPIRLLIVLFPAPILQRLHEAGVRWTKGSFARLLVLICQWFAPTRLLVSFEGDNLREEDVVVRDRNGRIEKLNLPKKLVLIANHQIYADWLYLWCLTYTCGLQKDVLILLKDSLKWVPIFGWGMQCFHFIFLARSWASDRLLLSEKLVRLAARAQLRATPLAFMIFPEGTLVSKDTRPLSKKFAEKCGIDDMRNTLLPRSTGLLHCLRSLIPQTPDLHLLDVTIGYEGIPPSGYGQSYYTLRSIFFDGVPSPRIHMHLRLFNVNEIPIGDLSKSPLSPTTTGLKNSTLLSPNGSFTKGYTHISHPENNEDMDPTLEEAALFEEWLRNLWREKDALLERFLVTGTFAQHTKERDRNSKMPVVRKTKPGNAVIEIPVELHSRWEIPDAFAVFAPVLFWVLWKRVFGISLCV